MGLAVGSFIFSSARNLRPPGAERCADPLDPGGERPRIYLGSVRAREAESWYLLEETGSGGERPVSGYPTDGSFKLDHAPGKSAPDLEWN